MTKQEYEARSNQYDECMQLPLALEYIASLEAEISQLQADNVSLIEQMNQIRADNDSLVDMILQMNQQSSEDADEGCFDEEQG